MIEPSPNCFSMAATVLRSSALFSRMPVGFAGSFSGFLGCGLVGFGHTIVGRCLVGRSIVRERGDHEWNPFI